MDKEIKVEFKWTIEELRTAYGYDNRLNARPAYNYCLLAAAVVFFLFSIYEFFKNGFYSSSGYSDSTLAIMFIVQSFSGFETKSKALRHFRKYGDRDALLRWTITESGLECTADGIPRHNLSWDDIVKSVETLEGTLLYRKKRGMFYWFPETAFESKEQYAGFSLILASRSIPNRVV